MCKKIERLADVRVEIEPDSRYWFWGVGATPEDRCRRMEEWAKELRDFFRDHRSQDVNSIEVVKVHETVCSSCGNEWETMDVDGQDACAYCGELVGEKHLAQVAELHSDY